MSVDCLQCFARLKLPCTVHEPREIDQLRLLRAADLIAAAFLPAPDHLAHGPDGEMGPRPAQVLAIHH